jgi:hypothetical protein
LSENLPETVYRELLADTRDASKTVKEPMKLESEDVQVFTVDAVLQLSNLPQHSEVLDEKSKRSRNPLSRRSRGGGRGVSVVV